MVGERPLLRVVRDLNADQSFLSDHPVEGKMDPIRHHVTRRTLIRITLGGVAASLLAACAPVGGPPPTAAPSKPAEPAKPAAPAPTQPVAAAIKPGAGATSAPTQGQAAPTAAPAAPAGGQPKRGGRLVVGQVGDNSVFEPFIQQPTTFPFLENLFTSPIRYDAEIKPHPSLAESWQLSNDGKSISMKLRQGVKFNNGREVTAEDVNFSVDRAKDPKVGSLFRPQAMLVTRTENPDKYTAVWHFDSPFPGAFDLLARQWVVDKDNVNDNDFKKRSVGSGPFIWTEWQPGEQALMKRNPDYWEKDLPYLDEIQVRSFGDANALAANLEAGAVDIIARLPTTEVARLKQNTTLQVFQPPVRLFYDVLLQSIKPPFNNKLLRQAINWSIDRERFVRTSLAGLSQPTAQPFPPHSWAWFPELDKTYTFDLDKARDLVTKAGYPDGLDVTCMTVSARQKELRDLAQIIAADLAKINVRVKIEDVEPAVYDPRHLGGEFEMAMHNYGRANLDPSTMFRGAAAWHAGTGMTKFDTPDYRRLIEDAESSYEQAERKPKYKKLIEYIQDESFVIPVAPNPEFYVMRSRVQGFTTDGESNMSMRQTWLNG
jgi:peptide/nickel transport system substrate-binding protein